MNVEAFEKIHKTDSNMIHLASAGIGFQTKDAQPSSDQNL